MSSRLIEKIRFTGICIFFVSWHQQLVSRKRSYEKRILQDSQAYLFCNNVHSSVQTFSLSKNSAKLSQKIPLKYVDLSVVWNIATFTRLCNQNSWDCRLLSAKLNFGKCRLISATRFFLRIYVNVTKFIPKVDKYFQKSHSIRALTDFPIIAFFGVRGRKIKPHYLLTLELSTKKIISIQSFFRLFQSPKSDTLANNPFLLPRQRNPLSKMTVYNKSGGTYVWVFCNFKY